MKKSSAAGVVVACLVFIWTIWYGFNDMESQIEAHYQKKLDVVQSQNDSLRTLSDSLKWETLRMNIDLGRYQVALDIFHTENPDGANQFETIISHTE